MVTLICILNKVMPLFNFSLFCIFIERSPYNVIKYILPSNHFLQDPGSVAGRESGPSYPVCGRPRHRRVRQILPTGQEVSLSVSEGFVTLVTSFFSVIEQLAMYGNHRYILCLFNMS